MIITCQECESSFNIGDGLVKEAGSKVKCSKCGNIFVVYPDAHADELESDAAISGLEQEDQTFQFSEEADADTQEPGLPDLDTMFDEEVESALEALTEDTSDGLGIDIDPAEGDADTEASGTEFEETQESDLSGLDTLLDIEEAPEPAEEIEMKAEELDLEFDLDTEYSDTADLEQTDELDLSDLEDLIDSDGIPEPAEPREAAADEPDLTLDLDEESVEAPSAEPDLTLDLDDESVEPISAEPDLTLDLDEESVEAPSAEPDLTLDLDEESVEAPSAEPDLTLDLDEESVEPTATVDISDELDLSDLEDIIESDETSAIDAVTVEDAQAPEPDMQLDFEVDEDSQMPDLAAAPETVDELDFSDEDLLLEEEEPISDAVSDESPQELDLEFDLEAEPTEPPAGGEEVEELDFSDLKEMLDPEAETASTEETETIAEELELPLDLDAESVEPAVETEQVEELDLSDLDQTVDSAAIPEPEEEIEAAVEELDLDFDLESESTTAAPQQTAADTQPTADEEEFLDLETMLEETGESAVEDETVTELQSFDLDLEGDNQEQDALDISESLEDDLEFNLLESDEAASQENGAEPESFDFQSDSTATDGTSGPMDDIDIEEFTESRDMYGDTDVIDGLAAETFRPAKKRRIGKALAIFSVFLILLAAVLILPQNLGLKIPYLSDIKVPYISDIKIPYLSDKFKPKAQDLAGNLRITPLDASLTYQFFDNSKAGMLFVIKGRVKNDYDHPRSFIRVTGKLYKKGNVLAKTATVYSGNLLSSKDLSSLDMAVINKRLQNKFGNRKSNLGVKTGSVVPFMIVFDKLPNNLDEYSVEVAGSS